MLSPETDKKLKRVIEICEELEQIFSPGEVAFSKPQLVEPRPLSSGRPIKKVGGRVLTPAIKAQILQMKAEGMGSQTISEKLGLKYQTVWAFVASQSKKSKVPLDDEDEDDDLPEDGETRVRSL